MGVREPVATDAEVDVLGCGRYGLRILHFDVRPKTGLPQANIAGVA